MAFGMSLTFLNCVDIHLSIFANFITLSVKFSTIHYTHDVMQPEPQSISKRFHLPKQSCL